MVSIDYKVRYRHGYRRMPHGRTVPHGRKQLAAGPPSWIPGGVSWAREQGRPARVYSQLGHQLGGGEQGRPSAGQGNRAGLGNGLGNRAGLGNGLGPAGLGSPPGPDSPESHGYTHSVAVGVAL